MFVDFRSLEDGALIECDLCIIGAGAAGITIARELAGLRTQVCLVEAGGLEAEPDVQDIYAGANVGHRYADLDATRLRFFGGTTNHWEGFCAPLAPIDFEVRSWVPYSGWPITRENLDPFYRRAQEICQLGRYAYGAEVWEDLGRKPHDFDPDAVELCFWQQSPPTRFGEVYRTELERARNVKVLLHGNVTNIQPDPGVATIRHVEVRTLDGKRGRVTAKIYVLACGGIENARLLLVSDDVAPGGLGNSHDLVGRFFMDHPHTEPAVVALDDADALFGVYGQHQLKGVPFDPSFCASPVLQEREQVLNSHAFLFRRMEQPAGVQAARRLWYEVRQGRVPEDLTEQVWTLVRDLDDVAVFGYSRIVTGERPAPSVETPYLSLRSEQAPNPTSRVTLGHKRDALGLRRIELDWRLTEVDWRTVEVMAKALGAEITRLDLARVRLADWLLDGTAAWPRGMHGGPHHLGTTRMAADPKAGVVDANSRVHGIDNLYVAGSSVFPTGGCANPTLTIVALALRLADRLTQLT